MKGKPSLVLIQTVLGLPGYKLLLFSIWVGVLTLFLWVPQVNLLSYMVTQAPLTFIGKLSFFFSYYANILASISNPIVLSLVIFSALTALSIVLLIFMLRTSKRVHVKTASPTKAYAATATSAFGSHLLSCGGTILLAALFPAFSGSSAVLGGSGVVINKWLSVTANVIGILIVLYTIRKISRDCVNIVIKQPA